MGRIGQGVGAAIAAGLFGVALAGAARAQASTAGITCLGDARPQIRTSLYFGASRPNGPLISELEWQVFLRDEVTPRFPDGLTVWGAAGQWRGASGRIEQEPSRVVIVVHPDSQANRTAIAATIAAYRAAFQQEAVLWESAPVCIAL